jgi:predicted TIM-barrel fold metal-dependent hydrolase
MSKILTTICRIDTEFMREGGQQLTTITLTLLSRLLVFFSTPHDCWFAFGMATSIETKLRLIDSHVHVWANSDESKKTFPYDPQHIPPSPLQNESSIAQLVHHMSRHGIDGALIVQPINHKFDHSYVHLAVTSHPEKFKGMILYDPSMSEQDAFHQIENLKQSGFVAVRFNPYLWPKVTDEHGNNTWMPMCEGVSMDVYRLCGSLSIPVGVMCFHGLDLHYDDIVQLLESSPSTIMILDHFGFTRFASSSIESEREADMLQKLLSLAKYPQVYVKVSASFRLSDQVSDSQIATERFQPLLDVYTARRLLFGSDFPYVLEHGGYDSAIESLTSWVSVVGKRLSEEDVRFIMGGTAEILFGPWAVTPYSTSQTCI